MDLVRVTLKKSYYDSPASDGTEAEARDLILRFGSEEAQVLDAGGEFEDRMRSKTIPGAAVTWKLNVKTAQSAVMPTAAVKHLFGDWTIPKTSAPGTDTRDTFAWEKRRVAWAWGDYVHAHSDPKDGIAGAVQAAIVAPPNVPHVLIERLDANMQPTGETIDPWAHFQWEDAVDKSAAAAHTRRQLVAGNDSDIEKLINEKVAEALAKVGAKK